MKVVILAGGYGTRISEESYLRPKPLIEINNKPILGYIIDHILSFGIKEIVVATGYRSNKIKDFIDENYPGEEISISDQGDVDIIERIRTVASTVKDDLIVLYGDTISNVNLNDLRDFSLDHQENITVTLWPLRSQFGVIETNSNDKVTSYKEKPILNKWINIGYFYFKHKALELLNNIDSYEEFLSYVIRKNDLIGYKHNGDHITVNTLKELQEAEKQIDQIFTLKEKA